jgi:DNA mismatch repair protein MutS
MGSRLLKRWLHFPLRDVTTLTQRQNAVTTIIECDLCTIIQPLLRPVVADSQKIERIALSSARPRDFARLRHALQQLPTLQTELQRQLSGQLSSTSSYLDEIAQHTQPMPKLQDLLEQSIVENPPVLIRDGGVIAPGYHSELDELRDLSEGATEFLGQLEQLL